MGGHIRSTTSSQGPSSTSSQRPSTSTSSEDESTDDDDEDGEGESAPAIQSTRSHDSGRTVLYPDLNVLTNDEHWTMTPEAHKYAAAAGPFLFRDYGKRRTTVCLQLDHYTVCEAIIVPR